MLKRGGHKLVPPSTKYPDIEYIGDHVLQCRLCDGVLAYSEERGFYGSLISHGEIVCYVARGITR